MLTRERHSTQCNPNATMRSCGNKLLQGEHIWLETTRILSSWDFFYLPLHSLLLAPRSEEEVLAYFVYVPMEGLRYASGSHTESDTGCFAANPVQSFVGYVQDSCWTVRDGVFVVCSRLDWGLEDVALSEGGRMPSLKD